jgi:hypothetical protein
MSGCMARDERGQACCAPGILADVQRGGVVCVAHVPQTPLLRYSLRRAMSYPQTFFAAALAELTDATVADELGCSPAVVWRLRLSRRPRPDHWDADHAHIAGVIACERPRLDALLCRLPGAHGR